MKEFKVLLSKTAGKELNLFDKVAQDRIRTALKELENNPFQSRPKADIKKMHKMSKNQFYRTRISNYRAVYAVENIDIKVTRIIPKGYEWLD